MSDHLKGTFRSLEGYNYRVWAAGALVSNVGTWMQRTAQDWIVLTELTHRNATAVGITMGLQFGPQILLLPLTGFVADHLDRRKVLFCTQAAMGLLALGLGLLVVTELVQLWHVYVFAFLLGCAAAFDAPARQTFVAELVDETYLPNAVALNSTSFHAARMIGPALAGGLIAGVGPGWVFLINALSFIAVLCSLCLLRADELEPSHRAVSSRGSFIEGFRYVMRRPDLKVILFMLFLVGTFGLNFPSFISTMSVTVFHAGAREYGLLTSMMAAGSVAGALMAAARAKPGIPVLLAGGRGVWRRLGNSGADAQLPAVRHHALCHRRCLADVHDLDQQPRANLDRAPHARARDRDPACDRTGRNAGRRTDRGLDCRQLRTPLGARRGRGVGTARCSGCDHLSRQAPLSRHECRGGLNCAFRPAHRNDAMGQQIPPPMMSTAAQAAASRSPTHARFFLDRARAETLISAGFS
jgi:MFS family permease